MGWRVPLGARWPADAMAVYTVTEILADVVRPILVSATLDPDLSQGERSVAAGTIPVVDTVLGDLNPQHIIPNNGRRNAAVSNLKDRETALRAVDRAHENFPATRLFNALDGLLVSWTLIEVQQPSDEVTF